MYLFAFLLAQDQREANGMQWFNYILERMKKTLKATVNWSEFLPEAERVQWT